MKRFVLAALVAIVIVSLAGAGGRPRSVAHDFNAFYCAGAMVAQQADPYRAEPLGACERAPKKGGFYAVPSGLTLPAPLPPYDLLVFSWLAHLPYEVAATIWLVAIVIALVASIEGTKRLTGLPRWLLWLIFAPIDGWSAVFLGEIAPFAVAALVFAMVYLRNGRPRVAAAILIVTLCEPHVGLAPIVALFFWLPRTRMTLAIGSLALAFVSCVSVGVATTVEYIRDVLPAHAASEITSLRQLSLTSLLHSLGYSDATALLLGSLSYVAMLSVGVVTARRLAARDPNDPLIIAAPAAFVLLGGAFIHSIQMPAAFPAALIAYTRTTGQLRRTLGIAIVVLSVPWLGLLSTGTAVPCVALIAGLVAYRLLDLSPRMAIGSGLAAACYLYGLELWMAMGDQWPGRTIAAQIVPTDLAEVVWGQNIRALANIDRGVFTMARLPDWIAIATIVVAVSLASRSGAHIRELGLRNLRLGMRASPHDL